MKLSSKIIIAGVVVVAALAVTYRAVNQAPDANLPADKQMAQIMEDGGCIFCHTANPDLPFYADYPIAKTLIKKDVEDGYKAFDIAPMIQAMKEGKAVNEVDLNKVEKAVMDGTMPLMQYYLAHWGSSLTSTKTDMVLAWVKSSIPTRSLPMSSKTNPCDPSPMPFQLTHRKWHSANCSTTTLASPATAPSPVPPATAWKLQESITNNTVKASADKRAA